MNTRSQPLLIDDRPLMAYKKLAVLLGINKALVLQQLLYLMNSQEDTRNEYVKVDDRWWVYNSYAQWKEYHFPWLGESTIKKIFREMESVEGGSIVLSRQSVKHKSDRRKWYTIDFEAWRKYVHTHELLFSSSTSAKNEPMMGSKVADGYSKTTIQEKTTSPAAPKATAKENESSTSIPHEDDLTCEGCLKLDDNGVCRLIRAVNPKYPANKNSIHNARCWDYTVGFTPQEQAIMDDSGKELRRQLGVGDDAPLVTGDGLLQDHNLPGAKQDDLCAVPPGNVVNQTAATTVGTIHEWPASYASVDPLSSGRFDAKQRRIVFDKPTATTIKLDPATLTKEWWSPLGRGLYYVNANQRHHVRFVQGGIDRCGEPLADAGVLVRMARKGHYKLTDDGREWVHTYIPKEWREAGIKAQEKFIEEKRRATTAKAQRRNTPPQPKGRKKVAPDIEPIYNAILKHWSTPGTTLTKSEHNRHVGTAWEFYHAQGTPDEIDEVVAYYRQNEWSIGTSGRILVNGALGTIRKERVDNAALPSIADLDEGDDYEPPDPAENIAYYADEEE